MQKHWHVFPPAHIMLAIRYGYKPPEPQSKAVTQETTVKYIADAPTMKIRRPGNV